MPFFYLFFYLSSSLKAWKSKKNKEKQLKYIINYINISRNDVFNTSSHFFNIGNNSSNIVFNTFSLGFRQQEIKENISKQAAYPKKYKRKNLCKKTQIYLFFQ